MHIGEVKVLLKLRIQRRRVADVFAPEATYTRRCRECKMHESRVGRVERSSGLLNARIKTQFPAQRGQFMPCPVSPRSSHTLSLSRSPPQQPSGGCLMKLSRERILFVYLLSLPPPSVSFPVAPYSCKLFVSSKAPRGSFPPLENVASFTTRFFRETIAKICTTDERYLGLN